MNPNTSLNQIIQESSQNKDNFLTELFNSIDDVINSNFKSFLIELDRAEILEEDVDVEFEIIKDKCIKKQVKGFKFKTKKMFRVRIFSKVD